MPPDLKKDVDGRLTIPLQSTSPGADQEANWLPVPDAPRYCWPSAYWPKEAIRDGQ
jgi:hypothetical protein